MLLLLLSPPCLAQEVNEREVVGILKHACECRPHASTLQHSFVCAVMDWVIRKGLHNKPDEYAEHLRCCHDQFMQAMLVCWQNIKGEKTKDRLLSVHSLHGERLGLIFGGAVVRDIWAHLDEPLSAQASLYNARKTNDLGKSMFDEMCQSILSTKVTNTIRQEIAGPMANMNMTKDKSN